MQGICWPASYEVFRRPAVQKSVISSPDHFPLSPGMADVSAVEETFRRLGATKGVVGVLVLNGDSIPIRSTMDNALSVHYAGLVALRPVQMLLGSV